MAKPHEYPTLVPYLMTFLLSWVVVVGIILWVGNATLFLAINQSGNDVTDTLFGILTYMGDGSVFLGAGAGILAADYFLGANRSGFLGYQGTPWWRRGVALLVAFAVSGLLAQGLKRLLFPEWLRPLAFFEHKGIVVRHPAWQELYRMGSFPSGHTTTAFCMACMLAFFYPVPRLQVALLVLAWVTAISRVMVGQHFPLDIAAGAMLGTAVALGVKYAFFPRKPIYVQPASGAHRHSIHPNQANDPS